MKTAPSGPLAAARRGTAQSRARTTGAQRTARTTGTVRVLPAIRARCVAVLAAVSAGACSVPDRGYYAPEGLPYGETLGAYTEESADALLDVRCQGAYVDMVDGRDVLTVHVQLDVARPRSGDLVFPRDAVFVDVERPGGGPAVELSLAEAWSGREPVAGDLVVRPFERRPFDLFFDAPDLVAEGVPAAVLMRWSARGSARMITGQTRFVRIPPGDPRAPSDEPTADQEFGMRNGYYLPGRVALGPRALQPSREERQHYIFHDPRSWGW